jgi:integrase
VKVKYIKRQKGKGGDSYSYERRVPKALIPVVGTEWIRKGLRTSDLNIAIQRADVENRYLESLTAAAHPKALYEHFVNSFKGTTDPEFSIAHDLHDEMGAMSDSERGRYVASLPQADQARLYADLSINTGKPAPAHYGYNLKDAMLAYQEARTGRIHPRSIKAMEHTYEVFVGARQPPVLAEITRKQVYQWIQTTTGSGETVGKRCQSLAAMFDHAQNTGEISENLRNPFRGHRMPKHTTQHYAAWHDDELSKVLELLEAEDVLPALVARYSGMRLAEVHHCTLATVEGVDVFNIAPLGDWTPKTISSVRMVPIHSAIRDAVHARQWPLLGDNAYGKRFSNTKKAAFPDRDRSFAFHGLRATVETLLLNQDWPELQVGRLLGHKALGAVTEGGGTYYRGPQLERLQAMVESIPKLP